jgi:hypothetical protein
MGEADGGLRAESVLTELATPASMMGPPWVSLVEVVAMPMRPEFHRSLADPSLLGTLRNIAHDLGYDLV